MKKNKMMRVASALLVAVLLTTCAISGTFAKYVSTASNSDTARVAKWAFNVGDSNIAQSNTFVFDPFSYSDSNVDVDGTGSEKVIAPGTTGEFALVLTNNSEVTAQFSINFTEIRNASDNGNVIPMQYSLTGADGTWVSTIDGIDVAATTLAMNGGTTTVTIHWKWAFEGPDHIDTDLGQDYDGVPNVTISAEVTVEQVG
ncbi:MAG: hypothetical protein IJX62_02890 [Clostridia bacterium]|nr:hypothetical protein [Clostridia bacterium]MBQ9131404.1 hypothetical protein [Clostridia bacterium]